MKRKLGFIELSDMAGGYYKFARTKRNGVNGYIYWMSRELNATEKETVLKYKNTELLRSHPEYAPELKTRVVFIGDKCFK